jgi:hypothetical protein
LQHNKVSLSRRTALLRGLVALVLIGLVLLVGTLSRSPGLHASFHAAMAAHHDGCPNHPDTGDEHADETECALCLFAHGGWLNDWLTPEIPVPAPVEEGDLPLPASDPIPNSRFTPTLGRGPPAHG